MPDLEQLAVELIKSSLSDQYKKILKKELQKITDIDHLRQVADKYTPHTEVSIPIYERILDLNANDVDAIIALGFLFFLDGEDSEAWKHVEHAKKIHSEHIGLLTLEAALIKDPGAKIALYRRILTLDPGNMVAQANLEELESQ